MRFPERERVIYAKNPLETVICQLRFPPILRIEAETPFQFQEKIRAEYPIVKERNLGTAGIPFPPEILKVFGEEMSWLKTGKQAYEFHSDDEAWTVTLTKEYIALTSKRYTRWEEFKERLLIVVSALEEVYKPAQYTRIGLRYRDIVNRSKFNLKGVDWSELLQPHIAGELNSDIGQYVNTVKKELLVQLDNGNGSVRIVHGLVQQPDTDEPCYLIDSDFSTTEKMEVNSAGERLNYFNAEAARLFKWCITPKLHQSMEPGPVPPRKPRNQLA